MSDTIHKVFQTTFEKGAVEVQFDIIFDGNVSSVKHIHIFKNFEADIPSHCELEFNSDRNRFELFTKQTIKEGDELVEQVVWHDSAHCMLIVSRILEIKEEETSGFIN